MKSPITGEPMKLIRRQEQLSFRKDLFTYTHHCFLCKDSNEEFTNTSLDELNVNQIYNQYRDKHNLPFPDEIKSVRTKYGLSAAKMSRILGLGANGYRNYENGEVPSLSNGRLIQSIITTPQSFQNMVSQSNEISNREKEDLLIIIDGVYLKDQKVVFSANSLIGNYHGASRLPDQYSGYVKPSFNKLANMTYFFAEKKRPPVTGMNKLLFYADFDHYQKTGRSISGTTYFAHNYGPVPKNFKILFDSMKSKGIIDLKEEMFGNGFVGETFEPSNTHGFDFDLFDKSEITSLERIFSLFRKHNATELMNVSHEEDAWLDNHENKNDIDYNYSFKLKHI